MRNDNLASIPIPPGNTIIEQFEMDSMSKEESAFELNISLEHLNDIIEGNSPITVKIAKKLETLLGLPAIFWLGLEESYQKAINEQSNYNFTIRCGCGCTIRSNHLSIFCPDCGANYNTVVNFCPSKQEDIKKQRLNDK